MKLIMMTAMLTLAMGTGCSSEIDDGIENEVTNIDVDDTLTPNTDNGTNNSVRTKSSLEGDGFTCTHLEGTTLTTCYKNGEKSWSCNDKGNCIQDARTAPPRKFFPAFPISTAVFSLR